MTFTACGDGTAMTDGEIIALHRWLAGHRTGEAFVLYDTLAACGLAGRHAGEHAGLIGVLGGRTGRAWLRWGDWRRVDWLADCGRGNCELFEGHPGACNPDIRAGMP